MRLVNFREGWSGHLWQARFASCPMDDAHPWHAARYIDLNPARAGPVRAPQKMALVAPGFFTPGAQDLPIQMKKVRWRSRQEERDHRETTLGGFGVTGAQWRRDNIPDVQALRMTLFNGEWNEFYEKAA